MVLTEDKFKKIEKALDELVEKSDGRKEITMAMVLKRSRTKIGERTVFDKFHEKGIYFHKLFGRLDLTVEDKEARAAWCRSKVSRSKLQWKTMPHAIIDNKNFQIYTTGKGREYAARRGVRGVYRRRGDTPKKGTVKSKNELKFPAPCVQVTAAVIKGRIRMFNYVDGAWTGKEAAKMYSGPLAKALRAAFPDVARNPWKKFNVIEDNDPTGYKSRKGEAAKRASSIVTDDLPKRSPDLNVLDYRLWSEINRRMRRQEVSFSSSRKETKEQYLNRLRKTALALPEAYVTKSVQEMHRRVRAVRDSEGGYMKND